MLSILIINHLIDYCFKINDIIFFHVGNNQFYKELIDKLLVIFGPTIRTRWNSQNSNLKKQPVGHLEGVFGENTFNKSGVISVVGTYFKYAQEMYRVHLQKTPRYEHPPMIPEREWKALIDYSKEKILRKEGKSPPGSAR